MSVMSSSPHTDFRESHSPKRRRLNEDVESTNAESGKSSRSASRNHSISSRSATPPRHHDLAAANDSYNTTDTHRDFSSFRPEEGLLNDRSHASSVHEADHLPEPQPTFGKTDDYHIDSEPLDGTLHFAPTHVLQSHRLAVSAVQFSPDGTRLATCSSDTTAKIWSVQDTLKKSTSNGFALLHTLVGHLAGLSTLAWAPDSKLLATGSDDKTIRLWNASTGSPYPKALRGHHNAVYSLAFSPKGNMLVSGSVDEAVFLWDVRAARLMRSLPAHSDPVTSVDFVRDGTLVASGSSDGLIRIWDTATGQCLRTIFHEDKPLVTAVKFSPNGRFVATWMLDSSIRLWDYVQGRCVKTYQGHKNVKFSLGGAFGIYGSREQICEPDAMEDDTGVDQERKHAFIASGSEDGSLLIWDVVSKAVLQTLPGHSGTVFGVDIHPSQRMLASCGQDCTVRIWQEREHVGAERDHVELTNNTQD